MGGGEGHTGDEFLGKLFYFSLPRHRHTHHGLWTCVDHLIEKFHLAFEPESLPDNFSGFTCNFLFTLASGN